MNAFNSFDPLAWASGVPANDDNNNIVPAAPAKTAASESPSSSCMPATTLQEAQAVADELVRIGANIAESYDDYLRLGFALAEGLGPDGHDIYHRLCAQSTKYSYEECERKWQECLSKQDGRITVKTFYKMAQQAGVDLSAISRQFVSTVPLVPLCHGSVETAGNGKTTLSNISQSDNNENVNNNYTTTAATTNTSLQSRDTVAQVAQMAQNDDSDDANEFDDSAIADSTFSDKIDVNDLPPIVRDAALTQDTPEGRDKIILGVLNLTSGFTPNVCGVYDRRLVYPPFYTMLVSPTGTDKGALAACLAVVMPIVNQIKGQYEAAHRDYLKQKAQFDSLNKGERANATEPVEPPYRTPLISVNASATAFYSDLAANGEWGAMFDTEADTLTQSLKQDYGDFSSGLRKAFHHETIDYSRRKDNEHVFIRCPRLSVMLTCTPGQVPLLLSPQNTENGMANRFVSYLMRGSRGWRNVFEGGEETLAEKMEPLGQRFKKLYDELTKFANEPLKFTLNEEQKVRFNQFFKPLYDEQIELHGDSLDAFIFRLGLTTFRIAMVLTVLRHEEQQPYFDVQGEPLVCSDIDFQTAITIAACLIKHTVYVYKRLLPHTETPVGKSGKTMSAQQLAFLQDLPQEFTSSEFVEIGNKHGLGRRTAYRYISDFITEYKVVVQVRTGHFRKL